MGRSGRAASQTVGTKQTPLLSRPPPPPPCFGAFRSLLLGGRGALRSAAPRRTSEPSGLLSAIGSAWLRSSAALALLTPGRLPGPSVAWLAPCIEGGKGRSDARNHDFPLPGNCVDAGIAPPYVGGTPGKLLCTPGVAERDLDFMLRLSCCVCGSMFLVADLPEGRPLCPRCHTVDAAVKKHSKPKRKPPAKPEKGRTDGVDSSS